MAKVTDFEVLRTLLAPTEKNLPGLLGLLVPQRSFLSFGGNKAAADETLWLGSSRLCDVLGAYTADEAAARATLCGPDAPDALGTGEERPTETRVDQALGEGNALALVLERFANIQKKIADQRNTLNVSLAQSFVKPIESLQQTEMAGFAKAKDALAKAKKAEDAALAKFESQANAKAVNPDKLKALALEVARAKNTREKLELDTLWDAKKCFLERDQTLVSAVLCFLVSQKAYFQCCLDTMKTATELINSLNLVLTDRAAQLASLPEERAAAIAEATADVEIDKYRNFLSLVSSPTMSLSDSICNVMSANDYDTELALMTETLDSMPAYEDTTLPVHVPGMAPAMTVHVPRIPKDVPRNAGKKNKGRRSRAMQLFTNNFARTIQDSYISNPLMIMRSNTSVTRFLATYGKGDMAEWITAHVDPQLQTIADDPGNIGSLPSDVLTTNDEVDLEPLKERFDGLLKSITTSIDDFPGIVRVLLKHVKDEISARSNEDSGYLAVGSFLFLRLIIPHITSFGAGKPDAQKALLCVGKLMQCVTGDAKKAVSDALQEYVAKCRAAIKEWYDKLLDINEDAEKEENEDENEEKEEETNEEGNVLEDEFFTRVLPEFVALFERTCNDLAKGMSVSPLSKSIYVALLYSIVEAKNRTLQ